ncbi:uncharacterized protein LOC119445532 isoform X1 [Dermacentor silvarum]|uniref:uncharacterized protein LOC119445532 isoform X1 n=1 Tax=Dermacentor silvarum TaxID=543639 RepID=UPI0021013BA4|nr:uncharacterized protein LOC119445532 isoform X1 [Dermacentor silvarum]
MSRVWESCDEPLQLTAWCDDAEEKEVAAMPPSVQPSSAGKVGPDGCRSWFIASLCFLVNLLFSSFFRCGGLFFTSMMSTYQATRAQAAMPLGAYCGFVNLSGLVAGALIHSFGMRISVLLGGLLMSAGCLASAFATGIPFLVVSIGVITGSGHGILLSCVIVAVNEYFDRRRGTALGINMAGAPAASFMFPKVFDFCLAEYGLQGTFALVGALLLNIGPISVLFRKPPWMREKYSKRHKVPTNRASEADEQREKNAALSASCLKSGLQPLVGSSDELGYCEPDTDDIIITSIKQSTSFRLANFPLSISLNAEKRFLMNRHWTGDMLETLDSSDADAEKRKTLSWKKGEQSNARITDARKGHEAWCACVTGVCNGECFHRASQHPLNSSKLLQVPRTVALENGSTRYTECTRTSEVSTSFETISIKDSMLAPTDALVPGESQGQDETNSVENSYCGVAFLSTEEVSFDFRHAAKERRKRSVLDSAKDVLSMPRFYAHLMSYFSFCFFLDTFLAVAVDCAVDTGISRVDAAHVLTFFSVTDTAGRLLIPQLTDHNIASPLSVMTLSYFLMAVIGSTMPHAQSTVVFWILVVTLGLPVGYVMVAMSQTIASDVGVHNLPMAYGFVAAATAVGAFMRPLVIGHFRDANGSYSGLFHFMGGMVFTSVLLTGWLWVSSTRKNKLKHNALRVKAMAD